MDVLVLRKPRRFAFRFRRFRASAGRTCPPAYLAGESRASSISLFIPFSNVYRKQGKTVGRTCVQVSSVYRTGGTMHNVSNWLARVPEFTLDCAELELGYQDFIKSVYVVIGFHEPTGHDGRMPFVGQLALVDRQRVPIYPTLPGPVEIDHLCVRQIGVEHDIHSPQISVNEIVPLEKTDGPSEVVKHRIVEGIFRNVNLGRHRSPPFSGVP
jgi:hypothetical protein